jgi:hypothetical protein
MIGMDIARQRLLNQRLIGATFDTPGDAATWFGAVQAQDYGAAKWAVGQRTWDATDTTIERAFDAGELLRTHVMRPTWHFVAPADIRWLLALTAPRVHMAMAYNNRRLELDGPVFTASQGVIEQALVGGKHLTRDELGVALEQVGIATNDLRLGHLMLHAELDGVICSGARRGKQMTYTLLEERAPSARPLARDEALAELAQRYFRSHGPATVKDYAWWSGLTMADARAGLEMVKGQFDHAECDDETYWFATSSPAITDGAAMPHAPVAHLLPNYDEYIVGYTDRRAAIDAEWVQAPDARGNVLFNYIMVLDGRVVGTWRRTLGKSGVTIVCNPFGLLTAEANQAFAAAAQQYGAFLGLPVTLV